MGSFVQRIIASILFALLSGPAAAEGEVRYVSDEIAIVLRDSARADGAARGVVTSGTRVTVLAVDAVSGYARVRTGDNREGWMLQRHLKVEPIARERVQRLEKDLAAAQADLKKVQDERARLMQDFQRISGGEPVASRELIEETEKLRAQLKQKDLDVDAMRQQYDLERASQKTLLLGGALVGAGFVLALLLRLLWPKKRWGDF